MYLLGCDPGCGGMKLLGFDELVAGALLHEQQQSSADWAGKRGGSCYVENSLAGTARGLGIAGQSSKKCSYQETIQKAIQEAAKAEEHVGGHVPGEYQPSRVS